MSTAEALRGAALAISATVSQLQAAGVPATSDAGAFFPQPVGVLVGLPTLLGRNLRAASYSVPVLVVSGDPLNSEAAVLAIYDLAELAAAALRIDQFRPSSWAGGVNAEPLPAIEMACQVTLGDPNGG